MKCLRGSCVNPQVQWRTEPPFDLSDSAHCCYLDSLIFRILEHWQLGSFIINAESTYKAQMFQLQTSSEAASEELRIDTHREAITVKLPQIITGRFINISMAHLRRVCLLRKSDCWNLLRLWKEPYDPVIFSVFRNKSFLWGYRFPHYWLFWETSLNINCPNILKTRQILPSYIHYRSSLIMYRNRVCTLHIKR